MKSQVNFLLLSSAIEVYQLLIQNPSICTSRSQNWVAWRHKCVANVYIEGFRLLIQNPSISAVGLWTHFMASESRLLLQKTLHTCMWLSCIWMLRMQVHRIEQVEGKLNEDAWLDNVYRIYYSPVGVGLHTVACRCTVFCRTEERKPTTGLEYTYVRKAASQNLVSRPSTVPHHVNFNDSLHGLWTRFSRKKHENLKHFPYLWWKIGFHFCTS